MKVTVAICTWNRAPLLDQTLRRFQQLRVSESVDWELLVVNNNCTDETDDVLARHEKKLPLRRLFEPDSGLSNARNCAVRGAAGEWIVWTDDDVLVSPQWLDAYASALRRWPQAAFFGGPVEAWFPDGTPKWLGRVWDQVSSAYAVRDFGAESFAFSESRTPFGANYAVKTEVQRRYRYDPELGVTPNRRLGFEEVTVIWQMLKDGYKGYWIPEAKVEHYIPRDRQTTRYLYGFFAAQGEYLGKSYHGGSGRHLLGKPLWMLRALFFAELRYRLGRVFVPPERWVRDLIQAAQLRGQLRVIGANAET